MSAALRAIAHFLSLRDIVELCGTCADMRADEATMAEIVDRRAADEVYGLDKPGPYVFYGFMSSHYRCIYAPVRPLRMSAYTFALAIIERMVDRAFLCHSVHFYVPIDIAERTTEECVVRAIRERRLRGFHSQERMGVSILLAGDSVACLTTNATMIVGPQGDLQNIDDVDVANMKFDTKMIFLDANITYASFGEFVRCRSFAQYIADIDDGIDEA